MTDPRVRILQFCKGIQVGESKEDNGTGVFFDTDYGVIGIVMNDGQLGLLISMIVEHANKIAEPRRGTHEVRLANIDPLPAQAVGVSKGPTPDTAYISFLMGGVNMTFKVKKTSLQSTFAKMAREIL